MKYSLLNHTVIPSGSCYPTLLKAEGFANSVGIGWAFQDPTLGVLGGLWDVPKDFSAGTVKVYLVWTAPTATANTCDWGFRYKLATGDATSLLDLNVGSTPTQNVSLQDAAAGTAEYRMEISAALTAANWAGSRTVLWQLYRDGVADTMTGNAILLDLLLGDA